MLLQDGKAISYLPDTLWTPVGADQRSSELSPIYVERYTGPLLEPRMTAHAYWEMILVCEGEGEMRCDAPFPLHTGIVCLMPPGIPHIEYSRLPMTMLWVGVRGSRLDRLPRHLPIVVHAATCARSALPFWEVARKAYGNIGAELDGWTLLLFARAWQAYERADEARILRIDEAVTFLHTHFHEELVVAELAARCGYSEGHFYRAFKHCTGQTPVQYLTALRVQEAQRWLMRSDLPIWRIAASVGFSDPHYFSRVFKSLTGHAPAAVRRKAKREG